MRLQLTVALLAMLVVLPAPTRGASEAALRVDVYDDGSITVVSPTTAVLTEVDGWTLEARYSLDALTGATPVMTTDAITSATTFVEKRHQADLIVTREVAQDWNLTGSYRTSLEPDYWTHALGLSLSAELFSRMATLTVSYYASFERVGAADDPLFGERAMVNQLDLSWNHILGRNTHVTFQATGQYARCGEVIGCHANPYRFVALMPLDPSDQRMVMAISERHPDERLRGAAAVRMSQAIGHGLALHGGYRFYADSWRISGHTADLSVAKALLDSRLVLRADTRASLQSPASFYQDDYRTERTRPSVPRYRTADRELAGVRHVLLGGRAEWSEIAVGPFKRVTVSARIARLWYRYPEHREFPTRSAWLIGGGVDVGF